VFDVAFHRSEHVPDLTSLLVRVSWLYDVEMREIPPLAWIPTEGERANKTPSKGSGIPENSCLFSIGLVIVSQE
jgi:hypothetical protein